jgi:hypothetical protein
MKHVEVVSTGLTFDEAEGTYWYWIYTLVTVTDDVIRAKR